MRLTEASIDEILATMDDYNDSINNMDKFHVSQKDASLLTLMKIQVGLLLAIYKRLSEKEV